jgi:choline-glycine betaine transporter
MKTPDTKAQAASSSVSLNHVVFWPPFLVLVFAVALNFISPDEIDAAGKVVQYGAFSKLINAANGWILNQFSWLFSLCAFLSLCLCIWICFSKFGKVRIGGSKAEPLMSMWNWFSITICTTIAIGILFWSTAEPIIHYSETPAHIGESGTPEAATFALSTMYLHWSFTPYALYCVASLMFAFAYYNMKKPFSLGSAITPLVGQWAVGKGGNLIDAVCLYSLVAGMAAALGTGILMLSGGLTDIAGIPSNKWVWAGIAFSIVATFIVSSATGLMNGIRILSDINTKLLMVLAVVALFFGPTIWILTQSATSLADYVIHFVPRNVDFFPEKWGKSWTIFYWAVWLAWAPITACFLGRISYGRTVREFMLVNFIFPSLFAIAWMSIFSGTALFQEINGGGLYKLYQDSGVKAISYAVFKEFPLSTAVIIFYMLSAFVCFVTSSDSNMSAMASISSSGISPENPEGNQWLKIVWGVTVGTVAWVMISLTGGTEGIKILSNLGGFPAAILELLIIGSLVRVVLFHKELSVVD